LRLGTWTGKIWKVIRKKEGQVEDEAGGVGEEK
jgi:hypothetical protein